MRILQRGVLLLIAAAGCGASGAQGGSDGGGGRGVTGTGGSPAPTGGASGGAGHSGAGGSAVTGAGGLRTNGTGGQAGSTPPPLAGSGCPLFTADDAWNQDVSGSAVDASWTSKVATLVGSVNIHPDFGPGFGIPINVVPSTQPAVPVTFNQYPDESDPGPYPFPDVSVARVEGTADPHSCDGDCHFLAVQQGSCMLYEGYACQYGTGWTCGNGAKWDLTKKSYGQRPEGWTSTDAAGLPVYAGLARYEELTAGKITHALRFTVNCTTGSHVPPATHDAAHGSCDPTIAPPMGLRVRLKASYDGSGLSADAQVFIAAMKTYGMILADNGSNFYFQSEDNPNWPDDINDLKQVPASAFEVVSP